MDNKTVYGLVLGGGGAKGAYQIGAWQALEKLGIRVGAVVGASIGAINGALYSQGDWRLARKAWSRLNLKDAIALDQPLTDPDNLFCVRNLHQLAHSILKQRGLDMEPVRKMLQSYIDEETVRNSPIDFGIISFDISGIKPLEIYKEDMPAGTFYDYILASACFPIFRSVEIEGQKFVDGGMYDNLPSNMLIRRGYKHLILIDVRGLGRVAAPLEKDLDIVTIRPYSLLGGTFDMSPLSIRTSMRRGYLDTYRAFGKLTGKRYYLTVKSAARFAKMYGINVLDGLEIAAAKYQLDPFRIYTAERLQQEVAVRFIADCKKYLQIWNTTLLSGRKSRIISDRVRIRKIEKDFLLPATASLLADERLSVHARDIITRIMPDTSLAAEAVLALGLRPQNYLEKPYSHEVAPLPDETAKTFPF